MLWPLHICQQNLGHTKLMFTHDGVEYMHGRPDADCSTETRSSMDQSTGGMDTCHYCISGLSQQMIQLRATRRTGGRCRSFIHQLECIHQLRIRETVAWVHGHGCLPTHRPIDTAISIFWGLVELSTYRLLAIAALHA